MTTRLLALPAILVALFTVAPSPVRSELPEAPAPRAKKTMAELLVGTWKLREISDKKVAPELDLQMAFTKDGRYTTNVRDPINGLQVGAGTYKLIGNTIRLTSEPDADRSKSTRDVLIESINEKEMKTVAGPLRNRQRSLFARLVQ